MASAQAKKDGAKTGKAGMMMSFAALTVLGAVGGGLVGKLVSARQQSTVPAAVGAAEKASAYSGDIEVKELPPIVTNLADVNPVRVRMVVSIVYAKKAVEKPAVLMARIGDDMVAFLKTLTLKQLQGASGLQALREDLNERAATRSQGAVREVMIEALVTQ